MVGQRALSFCGHCAQGAEEQGRQKSLCGDQYGARGVRANPRLVVQRTHFPANCMARGGARATLACDDADREADREQRDGGADRAGEEAEGRMDLGRETGESGGIFF